MKAEETPPIYPNRQSLGLVYLGRDGLVYRCIDPRFGIRVEKGRPGVDKAEACRSTGCREYTSFGIR